MERTTDHETPRSTGDHTITIANLALPPCIAGLPDDLRMQAVHHAIAGGYDYIFQPHTEA